MVLVAALCCVVGGVALMVGALVLGPSFPLSLSAAFVFALALAAAAAWLAWRGLVVKVEPNVALVRTGHGGARCYLAGTAFVSPLVHNVIRISLDPVRLTVDLQGDDATFTRDGVRLNVVMAFAFQVPARADCVLGAARSLGAQGLSGETLSLLLQVALESGVRGAVAQRDFESLLAAPNALARSAAAGLGAYRQSWLELLRTEVLDLSLPAKDTLRREPCNQKTLSAVEAREREGNSLALPNADSDGASSPDGRCRP